MIAKQITGTGQIWTNHLQLCTSTYNSFQAPASNGLNPVYLAFGRPTKSLLEIETNL